MLEKMLRFLAGTSKIEFSHQCNKVVSYKEALGGEAMYFVAGLAEKSDKRALDEDIKTKCYVGIDIDIRNHRIQQTGEVVTQEFIRQEINEIRAKLMIANLGDYCAIVDSGNGCHIYYRGKERSWGIEEYSNGVKGLMNRIELALAEKGYECDHTCSNLARLLRLPGSINPRKKNQIKKVGNDIVFDLGPIACEILYFEEEMSEVFDMLPEYGELYLKNVEEENKKNKEMIQKVKQKGKTENVRGEINQIPIQDLVEVVYGVTMGKDRGDIITIKESHKNMGAFIYKPYNIFVNGGSSLIKTARESFTPYELICFEVCNGNGSQALEWFKTNYNIDVNTYKENLPPVEKLFNKIGYRYKGDVFNENFGCITSGEIVMIAAGTNKGKTSFGLSILEANKDKKVGLLNMEFNIDNTFRFQYLRDKGYKDHQLKSIGTDLHPISEEEERGIQEYINKRKSEIDIHELPQDTELEAVVDKIHSMGKEGYGLVMLDSFSSIKGCGTNEGQEKAIKQLRNLCTASGITLILIHHFNKSGKKESGNQKVSDLCDVTIKIHLAEDANMSHYRVFVMDKDKAQAQAIVVHARLKGQVYEEVHKFEQSTETFIF